MKKETKLLFLVLIGCILLLSPVNGLIRYHNNSLPNTFNAGDKIKGFVNFSVSSENADAELTSNFGGKIRLVDFLEKNGLAEGVGYNCTILGCVSDYIAREMLDNASLSSGSKLNIGFNIIGTGIDITNVGLKIIGDAPSECTNQLIVDILGKGEQILQNQKTTGEICPTQIYSECFAQDITYTKVGITNDYLCQTIRLPPAPSYKVSANVTEIAAGTLNMELYDLDGIQLGETCELPSLSQSTQEVGCIIDYAGMETKDYYVCLYSDFSDPGNYEINSESVGEKCGSVTLGGSHTRDFEISVKTLKFDSPEIILNDIEFGEERGITLSDYFEDYVNEKYNGNCSEGCILPLAFSSGAQQFLTFSDAELTYMESEGLTIPIRNVNRLDEINSLINFGGSLLEISHADFKIPVNSTETSFELYLDGILVFDKVITLARGTDFDLFPKLALIGMNTKFNVVINDTIIESTWDFGDGTIETASGKSNSHIYSAEGTYEVSVSLTNTNNSLVSKTFSISVGDPRESADALITKYGGLLEGLPGKIGAFDSFVQGEIEKYLNVSEMNNSFNSIRRIYGLATTDIEFSNVVSSLLDLKVPENLGAGKEGNLPFLIGTESINLAHIKSISGEDVASSEEERLKNNIASWTSDNYDGNIEFETISVSGGFGAEDLFTKVKVVLNSKNGAEGNLIIGYPLSSISFKGDEQFTDVGGSGAYSVVSGDKTIEFIVPGYVPISELGIYISPVISELGTYETIGFFEKVFPWGFFTKAIIVLLIIVFVVYIVLQEWYKRRYESHLFKHPDQVYNLINFVVNARKAGLNEIKIVSKLKTKKWSGEQIIYAIRKLDGKRTGMWEIPILRPFEKWKLAREIKKRQQVAAQAKTPAQPGQPGVQPAQPGVKPGTPPGTQPAQPQQNVGGTPPK